MAAHPQRQADAEFGAEASGLAGRSVDLLLAQGRVDEARVELERLLVEGVESGSGRMMTEDLLDEIVAKARSCARRVAGFAAEKSERTGPLKRLSHKTPRLYDHNSQRVDVAAQ